MSAKEAEVALRPHEHYQRGQELLTEGERVVAQISDVKDNRALKRKTIDERGGGSIWEAEEIDRLTERMDELGKKAQGVWAQAQAHFLAASVPSHVVSEAAWKSEGPPKPQYGTEYLTAGHDLSEGGTR